MNIANYELLLKKTAERYCFRKINCDLDPRGTIESDDRVCLLRHDIDFSPKNALEMARLEHKLNTVSTFTVLLSGLYYNPFENETKKILKQIACYGHEIGLHFDPTNYDIDSEEKLEIYVAREAKVLSDLLEVNISMFSFHNTTDFSMNCHAYEYGGLVNAYAKFFQDKVEYTSDSNGYWKFRTWEELLSEGQKIIQILTHPIWWQPQNNYPPFETVVNTVFDRGESAIAYYNSLFGGQTKKLNRSALTEWTQETDQSNAADILNKYAKFPALLELMGKGFSDDSNSNLKVVAKKFIDTWT